MDKGAVFIPAFHHKFFQSFTKSVKTIRILLYPFFYISEFVSACLYFIKFNLYKILGLNSDIWVFCLEMILVTDTSPFIQFVNSKVCLIIRFFVVFLSV